MAIELWQRTEEEAAAHVVGKLRPRTP
jgi:hypothetical protein